jgi:Abortive infection alpha
MAQGARRRSRGSARQSAGSSAEVDGRLDVLDLVELGPSMVRMGALASMRAAGWATSSAVAAWRRVATAAASGESPGDVFSDARDQAIAAARRALGVNDIEETLDRVTSEKAASEGGDREHRRALRERGEELLARSAELEPEDAGHPAFAVVLEELAPDEVRILRVLARQGDQPIVDVEASGPLGVGGRPVARRLTLIDQVAAVRHAALLQLYLDNLLRLGLVRVDDDPLRDEEAYQVLEAQTEVSDAKDEASNAAARAKVVRRRLTLTHFGRSFCEICLPLDDPAERSARGRRRRRAK